MAFKRHALLTVVSATGNAEGASFSVQLGTLMAFFLDVTLVTAGNVNVYLQGSNDDAGAVDDWFDVFFDVIIKTEATDVGDTPEANVRNLNGATAVTVVGKFYGVIKHVPFKHLRVVYRVATGPVSFTVTGDQK